MIKKTKEKRIGTGKPGPGRPKGSRNKTTEQLRAAAQKYTDDALKVLHQIAMRGESDSARVAAASALLDRGWGKPPQALTGDGGDNAIEIRIVA